MDKNQDVPVTETGTGAGAFYFSGLTLCLKNLNDSIEHLSKSSILNKAAAAERVLLDARDFMNQSALISGQVTMQIADLKNKLDLVDDNLKRINAVMGFVHGK
jgi:hypothetical protein